MENTPAAHPASDSLGHPCACKACLYWIAYRARYETLAANDLAELAVVKPMSSGAVRARMRRMQIAGANPHAGREGGKAGYMRALATGYGDEIALANMRLRDCPNIPASHSTD